MSAADKLTKLMKGAAELPWKVNYRRNGNGRPGAMFLRSAAADYLAIAHICQRVDREQTAALIVYLANNAEAIRDLIVAAEEAAQMQIVEQWKLQEAIAKIKEQP